MTTFENIASITEYRELLLAIEPRTITTETQAETYRELIDALTDGPGLSPGQREMVGLLGHLVYDWEEEHEEPITASPQSVVRLLLEDRELRQRDLVPAVFATESAVSDFLAGRRPLTYDRVRKLAAFFRVSPAIFYTAVSRIGEPGT